MKILFITVGQPQAAWSKSAVDHYSRFLRKYATCEFRAVRAVSPRGHRPPEEICRLESDRILKMVANERGFKVLCDRTGRTCDSETLASLWRQGCDRHGDRAIVAIGGAWGVDDTLRKWADLVWSYGPGTFPHELALTIAIEQIARALSILRGDAYHK